VCLQTDPIYSYQSVRKPFEYSDIGPHPLPFSLREKGDQQFVPLSLREREANEVRWVRAREGIYQMVSKETIEARRYHDKTSHLHHELRTCLSRVCR
jgi:hypothetical protein